MTPCIQVYFFILLITGFWLYVPFFFECCNMERKKLAQNTKKHTLGSTPHVLLSSPPSTHGLGTSRRHFACMHRAVVAVLDRDTSPNLTTTPLPLSGAMCANSARTVRRSAACVLKLVTSGGDQAIFCNHAAQKAVPRAAVLMGNSKNCNYNGLVSGAGRSIAASVAQHQPASPPCLVGRNSAARDN